MVCLCESDFTSRGASCVLFAQLDVLGCCWLLHTYQFPVCHGIISVLQSCKQLMTCSQCCMCWWLLDTRHGVVQLQAVILPALTSKAFWICSVLSSWDAAHDAGGVANLMAVLPFSQNPEHRGSRAVGGDIFAWHMKQILDLMGLFINSGGLAKFQCE